MTTSERGNMIVWLTDSGSSPRASGSRTQAASAARWLQRRVAASTESAVTPPDAERGDAHRGRDRVVIVQITAAAGPTENRITTGIR